MTNKSKESGSWISTDYCSKFHFLSPPSEEIFIEDIAKALSKKCRYGGYGNMFYSVGEHCLAVAKAVRIIEKDGPSINILAALMHDCEKAYLPDIPAPIKHMPGLYLPADIYTEVRKSILLKFGILNSPVDWKLIDTIDRQMRTVESKNLGLWNKDWQDEGSTYIADCEEAFHSSVQVSTLHTELAFLGRFYTLLGAAK